MGEALSVTRSGLQTFARYRNVKAGYAVAVVTGGILYADSTYNYRVFVANGTLSVATTGVTVDVLVIGGGGSGATRHGGGGGAGGLAFQGGRALTPGNYAITVGAGGASVSGASASAGTTGSNSTFDTITALGGGGGGSVTGGSGGGGTAGNAGASATQGNSGGATGYGNAGGWGSGGGGESTYSGGGGGGAGGVGGNSSPYGTVSSGSVTGGTGGAGLNTWSTWASVTSTGVSGYYAGGGGGGAASTATAAGPGGSGGGSAGSFGATNAANATINTGSGGGGSGFVGASNGNSGAGGSGIVIVRYPKNSALASSIWQSDSYASSLKVATPLSSDLIYNDYSATILGSGTNRTMTTVNSPAFQTSVSKFYGSSLNMGLYTDNKYISTPTNANLQIGTSDFTIEGWYYLTNNAVSGGYQCFASHAGDSGDQQPGWVFILEANTAMAFYACTAGSTGWGLALTTSTTPTANAWHHVAVTRASGVVRMFLDGTQVGTVTSNNNIGVPASQTFRIGSYQYFPGPVAKGLSGYVQDFRFYIGAAKYTGAFTPPAQIYVGG